MEIDEWTIDKWNGPSSNGMDNSVEVLRAERTIFDHSIEHYLSYD